LQIGDHVAHFFEVVARQERLALDHDQHVELGRRKALGHRLVLLEILGVGAEQLAQGVVDLDALDAEHRGDHQREQNDDGQIGALIAISPIFSSPKAMLVPACGSSIASTWT